VDRYGNSDYLFGWDIMNEIDWTWGGQTAATIRTWTDRMSAWLIQYERQKWGKNHIITVNSAGTYITGDLQYSVFRHPNIDLATTHMYDPPINDPTDTIGPAVKVNELVKVALGKFVTGDRRPYFDSEDGPITDPIEDEAFENEYYHNMIWAHLASGGAGSDLRWPFRTGGPSEGMFDSDLAMSRIIKNINWSKFSSENIDTSVTVTNTGGHTVIDMACGDSYTALVFVLQDSRATTGNISGANLNVASMTAGTYLVKYFNSYTGELISSELVNAVSGSVNVTLPDFNKDIVIILVNRSISPTVNRKPDAFITSPPSGTGTGQVNSVTLLADAVCADDTTVNRVEFWANYNNGASRAWRLLNTDYTAPYSYQWDISSVPDQKAVEIRADVYDNKGLSRTAMGLYNSGSTTVTNGGVTLERASGDTTAGYGSFEFPPPNATINTSKIVTFKARAWDISSGVNRVKFWIQGNPGDPGGSNTLLGEVYTPTSGVYTLDVNLSDYVDSTRWVSLTVVDNSNNTTAPADQHSGIILNSNPPDVNKPTGGITSPAAGDVITSGPVTVSADANDTGSGINRVEFRCYYNSGWHSIGTDYNAPYSIEWPGVLSSSQKLQFAAGIYDNAGYSLPPANTIVSGVFYESVANGDTFAPWANVYFPDVYTPVWAPVTLKAVAGDRGSSGVKLVVFSYYLDGQWYTICYDYTEPYECSWDTSSLPFGSIVQIRVGVVDMAGNFLSSADVHSGISVYPAADINHDEVVDCKDLAIMAEQWLKTPGTPSADIAPLPAGDGEVNFLDFAALADNWLCN
jgi:hypothetical protein